ncbi:MAG: hypothetical protein R3F59_09215 [Myxococcota bacterium]
MLLALLLACRAPPSDPLDTGPGVAGGIQIGEEGDGRPCVEVLTAIDDLELPVGALDFPPSALPAALPPSLWAALDDGTPLWIGVSVTGDPVHVTERPIDADGDPTVCDREAYQVDVTVTLRAPPRLDVQVALWARATAPGAASWSGEVPADAVNGDLPRHGAWLRLGASGPPWAGSGSWIVDEGLAAPAFHWSAR